MQHAVIGAGVNHGASILILHQKFGVATVLVEKIERLLRRTHHGGSGVNDITKDQRDLGGCVIVVVINGAIAQTALLQATNIIGHVRGNASIGNIKIAVIGTKR